MYFFPLSKTCFAINLPPDDVKKASCSFDEKSVFGKHSVMVNEWSWQSKILKSYKHGRKFCLIGKILI